MPRPKKIDYCVHVSVRIPTSIMSLVELELYSELIGKVPFGAKSELVESLLRDWLKSRGVSC